VLRFCQKCVEGSSLEGSVRGDQLGEKMTILERCNKRGRLRAVNSIQWFWRRIRMCGGGSPEFKRGSGCVHEVGSPR